MKTVFGLTVAAFLALSPIQPALADDHGHAHADVTTEMAVDAVTEVEAAVETNEVTLLDGGTLVVEHGMVYTVDAEGIRSPASDGDYTLSDNTLLTVRDGAAVTAESAEDTGTVELELVGGEAAGEEALPE